ncbi:MAG: UDP-N-acetylmuramoyl-L-alanyl-D-glutamate--2,6-diaminopimelate ligase [Polyangiaceae bacterium]
MLGSDLSSTDVARRSMSLRDLADQTGAQLGGDGATLVAGVKQDSRRVEPGDLFVALRGQNSDGALYIRGAQDRGAVAVLLAADRDVKLHGLPCLQASEPRVVMAHLARLVYGDPTASLRVVGITGTNGKTTTAHLLTTAIRGAGGRTAVIGTLGSRFEEWEHTGLHTSPEADEIQRVAAQVRARGASHLVMEVSSIGLAVDRLEGVSFDVAAFTNLTQDHLNFHGSMTAYAEAKDRLFFEFVPRVCVIDVDDSHGEKLARRIAATGRSRVIRVSVRSGASVEVHAANVEQSVDGMTMTVHTPMGDQHIHAPLLGQHNVSNLVLTLGVIVALEMDVARAAQALATVGQVPGRLERCDSPAQDDVIVLVDYAHTPDALRHALTSLRALATGELWCVFGCGGDRDSSKRGPMGEIVARFADHAVVTNDNPRSESPDRIAEAIVAGIESAPSDGTLDFSVELDRHRAIRHAIGAAAPGDVVLIAGKGHEPYQILGEHTCDFDDRVEARQALSLRREGLH